MTKRVHDCEGCDGKTRHDHPNLCSRCRREEGSFACKIRHLSIQTGDAKAAND